MSMIMPSGREVSGFVVAEMRPDSLPEGLRYDEDIPHVVSSNHPRFTRGTRLDWGFVQTAIDQGYAVLIYPRVK